MYHCNVIRTLSTACTHHSSVAAAAVVRRLRGGVGRASDTPPQRQYIYTSYIIYEVYYTGTPITSGKNLLP